MDIKLVGDKRQTDTKALAVDVKLAVPRQRVAQLLVCAIEGGISYWCERQEFKKKEPEAWEPVLDAGDEKPSRWPMYDYPLLPGGEVSFKADDGSGEVKTYKLNLETLTNGLALMAEKCPHQFANFMQENEDAGTGDVFVQLCCFGEVVYG